MIIQIGAEIRIKNPTPQLKKWCDENLVIRNPEYDDRMRRGLWTGKTPEYLWLFRVDGQDLVVPTGTGKEIRKFLTEQDPIEIHLADPGRLVDHASGWFDQGGGDVKSAHNYFRPLRVRTEQRPFILSEYGGYSCPVDGHLYSTKSFGYHSCKDTAEFTATWQILQKKIRELQGKGLAGAVYTQLSDVEEETNGLYTYDRKVCKVERKL